MAGYPNWALTDMEDRRLWCGLPICLPERLYQLTFSESFIALILHTSYRGVEIDFCRFVYFPTTILALGIPILKINLIGEKMYLIIILRNAELPSIQLSLTGARDHTRSRPVHG